MERKVFEDQLEQIQGQLLAAMIENQTLSKYSMIVANYTETCPIPVTYKKKT